MAKYRLTSATYLYAKGDVPGLSSPTYLEEGALVGDFDGTSFEFQGPPNRAMVPLDDAAQSAWDEAHPEEFGAATVKGTSAPAEGGAAPFDPASGKTDSDTDADKAAAKKKDDDAKAAKAAEDAKAAAAAKK